MARKKTNSEGFAHSLTDLMTSIAVIFILLFLVFVDDKQKEIAEIASQKKETISNLEELLRALKQAFGGSESIKLKPDENDPLTLLIVLHEDPELLAFEKGSVVVKEKGTKFLSDFVPKLSKVVCSAEAQGKVDSLIIEGHTDSDWTGKSTSAHDGNTSLSAQRATAVLVESRIVLHQEEASVDEHDRYLEECFLGLARATGRGMQELIWRPEGAGQVEDKDASRRVVVKVRVKSVEQRTKLALLADEIAEE